MQRDMRFQGSWTCWDAVSMGNKLVQGKNRFLHSDPFRKPIPVFTSFKILIAEGWREALHSSGGSHGAQGAWIGTPEGHTASSVYLVG